MTSSPAASDSTVAVAWFLLALAAGLAGPGSAQEKPSRALSRALCSAPRLAGTTGSRHAAHFVGGVLRDAGFEVEFDERVVLLSLPRRIEIDARANGTLLFHRLERFDPDRVPAGDVPKFNAWAASGTAEGNVIDVGRGLRADYDALRDAGIDVAGCVAIARYGGAYRGVKADLAQAAGCVALLLFSEASADGAGRGEVWPKGPWKPGWDAQRGSIAPLAHAPGDPSTPGWASPAPGEDGERLAAEALSASLPGIACLPIGADEAELLVNACAEGRVVRVKLQLEIPRELRTIVNVVARLAGRTDDFVVAGNHRDAWVRGAQDAGSGTVALLRAAQHLGQRARSGWRPEAGIVLGFWDAEEPGLIGSTEWGEAHASDLREHALAYVNADAVVSGLRFGASGSPGLLGSLRAALERVPAPTTSEDARAENLWQQWSANRAAPPTLALPGSGSDYTVFLHHLGIPILDISFGGGSGSGQYHTAFDDFGLMDRFIDPTWEGHETAGHALAEILAEFAEHGRAAFDYRAAAEAMARMVRAEGLDDWFETEDAERLAGAFDRLALVAESAQNARARLGSFYRALEAPNGLSDRPWYRNRLWAPGLETGYAAESLPTLRLAARTSATAYADELDDMVAAVHALETSWRAARTEPAKSSR